MKKFGILILAALAGGSWIRAQDRPMERIFVSLSQPDRPGTLVIKHDKGSISVLGYEGNEVIVEATRRQTPTPGEVDRNAQGMTRVPAATIQISARELDNTVTVISNSRDETLDLNVKVPRRFSLHLGTIHNGRIVVRNVEGEFEISNTNGDIQLDDVSGSAVLNTFDGHVTASFLRVAPDAPMAFSTVYGKVDVSFPADVRMRAKMKTDNGRIYTDFEMSLEQRRTRQESRTTGEKRIYLEEWTYARINGGGPEMLFTSFDGNIYLRKIKEPGSRTAQLAGGTPARPMRRP